MSKYLTVVSYGMHYNIRGTPTGSLPVLSVTHLTSVGILYYCYYGTHYVIQQESCRWTERARCSDEGRGVWRVHSGEARGRHCLTAPPRWHTGYTITIHKCTYINKYLYICNIVLIPNIAMCNCFRKPRPWLRCLPTPITVPQSCLQDFL